MQHFCGRLGRLIHVMSEFMKIKSSIFFIIGVFLIFFHAHAAEIGHVAFFYEGEFEQNAQDEEAYADLIYYFNKLKPWFDNNGLIYSIHTSKVFSVTIGDNEIVHFNSNILKLDMGIVLIQPNGDFKEILIGTDIDVIEAVKGFYNIHKSS